MVDEMFRTRKKRIFAAGSVSLPMNFSENQRPYELRSQVNSSFQGEIAAYNMINLKIPNYQPPFNFFDFGKGKVLKQVGHLSDHENVFVFGDIRTGKFLAIYGAENKGESIRKWLINQRKWRLERKNFTRN